MVTQLGARPLVLVALTLASIATVGTVDSGTVSAEVATSRFETGNPCRLTDVRDGTGFERVNGQIVRVYVTGRCGVPTAATAVALTVTVDNSTMPGPGYVSIWPEGAPIPTASIINYRAREIRANATIVKVGIGGAVDLLAQNGAPVIVD